HHELLDVDFGRRLVRDHAAFYFAERFENYLLQFRTRFFVHREPLVVPTRFELLDEICTCHDIASKRSDHLDRTGIDTRDVRDVVVGRVLHRDALAWSDSGFHLRFQQRPFAIDELFAGQGVELVRLDRMYDFYRLASRRDEIKPSTRSA